MVTETLDTVNH